MNQSKGMQLGALLGAMLLVSMVLAAVVSAESAGQNLSNNTMNLSNNTIPQEKLPDNQTGTVVNNTGIGDLPMPVFPMPVFPREDVIVYFKEMPPSINGFASKYGVTPIFVKPDIKMAAFETLPKGEPGRVSQWTLDKVSELSNDTLVEKAFRDEYRFISIKAGYLVFNAETGYYSTDPLIQGPEYYEKLGVEYLPNIVRVGFWRTPPSLEEFASKYGVKLMEQSEADKFFMSAGFETDNISDFISKISTDPYVQHVALDSTGPSLGSISANNTLEKTPKAPGYKAPGFESILSIGLLAFMVYMMRRRKKKQ